jgi:hypothetical protein
MPFANTDAIVGNQQIAFWGLPDTTARQQPGLSLSAVDSYWGGAEFIYCRATASIRQFGLVRIVPTLQSTGWRYDATEVGNTANLGDTLAVCCTSATVGQYFWAQITGVVPINCNASVAADTTFGIAAAGQGGANSAGKQVLNARIIAPATTTVVKTAQGNSGSLQLTVTGNEGWFIGAYLSGTGIAANTVIVDMSPNGNIITLNNATTALVNGSVTATYNNGTVFYNVAHINRPFAQGAIT